MGVSTAELGKMLEAGTVMSDVFLPKFAAQLRRELGQTTEEVTRTAGENFARFGNAMTLVADNLAKNTGLLDWLGNIAGKLADIVVKGDAAAKELDAVAKKRTQEDIQRATSGAGAEDTAANKAREKQLEDINRQIKQAEMAMERLGRLALREPIGSAPRERLDVEIKREERMIRDLQEEKARLAIKPKSLTGLEAPSIGMEPFAAEGDKNRAIVKQVQDILKGLQDATNQTSGWRTEAERLKDELKAIEQAMEKLQKLPGMGRSSKVNSSFGAPANIKEAIERIAPEFGLDANRVAAIVKQESGFQPRIVSKAGAKGLMQLMPGTAKEMGVTDPFDIDQNLRGGMGYYRKQLDKYKDEKLALAAYNAGPGAVDKYGGIPPYPETQDYVKKIMASSQGASAAAPEVDKALADLGKRRAALDQQIKTSAEVDKMEVDANKAVQDAIAGRAGAMDQLRESLKGGRATLDEYQTADIRTQLTQVQGFEASKAVIENLLNQVDARREVVAALEREEVEYKRLAEVQKQQAEARQKVTEAYMKAVKQQSDVDEEYYKRKLGFEREISDHAIEAAKEQAEANKELGRITLDIFDAMGQALKGGEDAWIQFAETVTRMLLKVAMEQSNFEGKLGDWIKTGVGFAIKLISASAGTPGVDLPAGDIGKSNIDFDALRASGGPVTAGKAYIVGESGKELFIPQTSGTIVNNALTNAYTHGATMMANAHSSASTTNTNNSSASTANTSNSSSVMQGASPVQVTVNVQTQDMASFSTPQSRAQVQRAITQAMQAAQRSS